MDMLVHMLVVDIPFFKAGPYHKSLYLPFKNDHWYFRLEISTWKEFFIILFYAVNVYPLTVYVKLLWAIWCLLKRKIWNQ